MPDNELPNHHSGEEALKKAEEYGMGGLIKQSQPKDEDSGAGGAGSEGDKKNEINTDASAGASSDNNTSTNVSEIKTDWSAILGDGFKSEDDVKAANIPAQLKELQTLRTEVDELRKGKTETPKPAFAAPEIEQYNSFVARTGIKDWGIFERITTAKIPENPTVDQLLDIMVLDRVVADPRYKGYEEKLRDELKTQYKVMDGVNTADEIDFNKLRLEGDSKSALSKLSDIQGSLKSDDPEEQKKVAELQREESIKNWTPTVEKLIENGFQKMPVIVGKSADGKPITLFEMSVPPEVQKQYAADVLNLLAGEPPTEKALQEAYTYMNNRFLVDHKEQLFKGFADHVRSMTSEEYDKAYHNPSGIDRSAENRGGQENSGDKVASESKRVFDMVRSGNYPDVK